MKKVYDLYLHRQFFFKVGDLGNQQFVMTKTQKFDVLGVSHPGLKFNSSNNVFTTVFIDL